LKENSGREEKKSRGGGGELRNPLNQRGRCAKRVGKDRDQGLTNKEERYGGLRYEENGSGGIEEMTEKKKCRAIKTTKGEIPANWYDSQRG